MPDDATDQGSFLMHLLARDDEFADTRLQTPETAGQGWCRSPEFLTACIPCSGHRQIIEPEILAAQLCIGFDLGWEPRVGRSLGL